MNIENNFFSHNIKLEESCKDDYDLLINDASCDLMTSNQMEDINFDNNEDFINGCGNDSYGSLFLMDSNDLLMREEVIGNDNEVSPVIQNLYHSTNYNLKSNKRGDNYKSKIKSRRKRCKPKYLPQKTLSDSDQDFPGDHKFLGWLFKIYN